MLTSLLLIRLLLKPPGKRMDLFDESYERHKQSVGDQEARWNDWLAQHPLVLVAVGAITVLIILLAMYLS
jgi:hypothetical protein